MSVTIVSTLPKQTQAVATDNNTPSGDATTAGVDFASLLLGQLLPIVPPALSDARSQADQLLPVVQQPLSDTRSRADQLLPVVQHPLSDTRSQADLSENLPQDAASVLASLGLGLLAQGRGIDVKSGNSAGEATVNAIATGTAKSIEEMAGLATQDLAPDVIARTRQPPELTATSDKPAKFAVPATLLTADGALPSGQNTPPEGTLAQNIFPSFIHSTPAPVSRNTSLAVPTSYRDQGWATDFSQKVVWLASNDKQSAQLTLNPPQMGPIEISLSMDKGNVTASFSSANADVREAIETALPRLREMFANAGIALGQTNVGAESFQQQPGNSSTNYGASQRVPDNAILVANSAGSLPARAFAAQQGNGMVDIFA